MYTDGKLDTYFSFQKEFNAEPYLMLVNFYVRKAISKLRLSAHNLFIQTGRYAQPKSLPRSERICKYCNFDCIENEFYFLSRCSFSETERAQLYSQERHKTLISCRCVIMTKPCVLYCKSRKETPQKLTQSSSRSHPRHLVGKRTAQK